MLACSFSFFLQQVDANRPRLMKASLPSRGFPSLWEREMIEARGSCRVVCSLVCSCSCFWNKKCIHWAEITFYVNVLMSHDKWMLVRSTLWTFTQSWWLSQRMSYSLPCAVAQTLKSFYPLPTTLSWLPAVDVQKTWKISTYLFPATCSAPFFFHLIFQNEAQLMLYSLESVLKWCLKKPNKTSLIPLIKTLVHLHIQNYPVTQCMIF